MCLTGNQTIYAVCRDKALSAMNQNRATNEDIRGLIASRTDTGCLMTEADKQARLAHFKEGVLVS